METDHEYWEGLAAGQLRLPRCAGCNAWQWPVVVRCAKCGHWGSNWQDVAIKGRVFSWTRTWHGFGGLEGFVIPFFSVIVEVNGTGVRLMGLLDEETPASTVRIGASANGQVTPSPYSGGHLPVIRWHLSGADK